jgi:hypothetical protein
MPINRNTLTDVHTYDSKTGEDLGTSYIQISFAHATGGDKDGPKSCENVERAVSDLLYGQKINGYVSLSMDGIQELIAHRVTHALASSNGITSEAAGGVSVTYNANWINSARATALPDDNKEVLAPFVVRGVF